jgi:hypothetical protein
MRAKRQIDTIRRSAIAGTGQQRGMNTVRGHAVKDVVAKLVERFGVVG